MLTARIDGEAVLAVACERPMRLKGTCPVHRVAVVALEDVRGLGECRIDVAPLDGVLLADVRGGAVALHVGRSQRVCDAEGAADARTDLVDERRIGRHRLLGGEDGGEFLPLDRDVPNCLLSR